MTDIEDLASLAAKFDRSNIRAPASLQEVVSSGNCMGCGICESIAGPEYIEMKVLPPEQRMRPVFHKALEAEVHGKALAACPGAQVSSLPGWKPTTGMEAFVGKVMSIQRGYASDPETRFKAAAAGGLTTLGVHLIESKQVDFVVHVKACALYSDETTQGSKLSFTSAEVFDGRGSRYGPVAPLKSLEDALRLKRPFAVVAKPCDINAVRNYAKVDPRVDELCKCLMTVSCGTYADNVCVDKFLKQHEVEHSEVEEFRWRGHGCPGHTPYVKTKDGREVADDYVDFWFYNGKEAGPLTYQWRCKMCSDFLGYQSDVVVMDCWPNGLPERRNAITEERKHEWDGWVLIIARTQRGQDVVDSAKAAGMLTLGPAEGREVLQTQPHQARRAASNFIRRYSHASRPLTALDEGAALQVAKWAMDEDFVDEVMATGPAAPVVADAAEQLREILPKGEAWAEEMLKMPERHIAYHLDNFKGTLKRLERGDASETVSAAVPGRTSERQSRNGYV
mmetsp:Transcript_31745/g.68277  ORF Transcript_31745/g.68277 Transcript_31745/m.68277 type:complete len:507 (+) Transcript_31745:102-1622(+)